MINKTLDERIWVIPDEFLVRGIYAFLFAVIFALFGTSVTLLNPENVFRSGFPVAIDKSGSMTMAIKSGASSAR